MVSRPSARSVELSATIIGRALWDLPAPTLHRPTANGPEPEYLLPPSSLISAGKRNIPTLFNRKFSQRIKDIAASIMFVRATVLVLCFLGVSFVCSAPMAQSKRISQQALMRLILQRGGQADYQAYLNQQQTIATPVRRNSEPQPQRRSFDMSDDDFQNCFLSPVQCMLPTQSK